MTFLFPILLAIAAVLLFGVLGDVVFQRTGISSTLWLIVCGLLLGPVLGLFPREQAWELGPVLAATALCVLLDEIRDCLSWSTLRRDLALAGPRAAISFGVSALSVTLVAGLAHEAGLAPEAFGWKHALLLGAVLAAPCAWIITPILQPIAPSAARIIHQESVLGASAAILWCSILIALFDPRAETALEASIQLARSLLLGVGIGALATALWVGFLFLLRSPAHHRLSTLAMSLIVFATATQIGSSGAIAVLVFTLTLANVKAVFPRLPWARMLEVPENPPGRQPLISFFVASMFFVFTGLVLGPPWDLMVLSLLLCVILFPPRILAVLVGGHFARDSASGPSDRAFASVAIARGILAGALALLPFLVSMDHSEYVSIPAFTVMAGSITIFTAAFAILSIRENKRVINSIAQPHVQILHDKQSQQAFRSASEEPIPPTTRSPSRDQGPRTSIDKPTRPLPPPVPPPRRHEK